MFYQGALLPFLCLYYTLFAQSADGFTRHTDIAIAIFMEAKVQLTKLSPITTCTADQSDETLFSVKMKGAPEIRFTLGHHAPQADLSIWVEQGQTRLLVALTVGPPPAHADFRPLTVDYLERPSAVAGMPGNFQRRELRQSDHEIRVSRLIDRALRPLFDAEERREIHLVVQVLSVDSKLDLVGLAITSAGLAASCSCLPFNGPVVGASLKLENDDLLEASLCPASQDFEWVITTHLDGLVMIEGGANGQLSPAKDLVGALKSFADNQQSLLGELAEFTGQYSETTEPYHSN